MIQSSLFAEPGRPGRASAGGAVVRICREEPLVLLILLRTYEVFGCHGDTVRGQVPRGLPQPPPQLVFAPLRLTGFGEAPKSLSLSVRTAFLGPGHPTNLCLGEVQQAGGDVNAHDLGDPHDGRSHFGVRGGDQGVLASKHLGSTPDRRIEPGHRNAVGTDRLGCGGLVIAQPLTGY
jgi:hypothetical protein